MFCANTRPLPVATTDFGEMLPVTVFSRVSGRSTAGWAGTALVVVNDVDALVWTLRDDEGAGLSLGCCPAARGWESDPPACTPNTIAAPMIVTTKNAKAARRCTAGIVAGRLSPVDASVRGGRRMRPPRV